MKVAKNEPLPKTKSWSRWPFDKMDKGDCLILKTDEEYKRARSAAYMFKRRNPDYEFTCRRQEAGGKIWRL